MPRRDAASQRFCFTLNNYVEEEEQAIRSNITSLCKYGIIGRETGENGTKHLQGYCITNRTYTFSQFKENVVNERTHVEKAGGDSQTNRRYCRKDGDVWEHGRCPGKESRMDRDEIGKAFVRHMESGGTLRQFMELESGAFMFHGHTLLRNYFSITKPIERHGIRVQWLYGVTGVGKSRRAHSEHPDAYVKESRSKWWNGYALEREVIIDDFAPKCIDINYLLRWFDYYKCNVETKGGMMPLYADNFVVTSNFSPSECYRSEDGREHPQIEALERRIEIIRM